MTSRFSIQKIWLIMLFYVPLKLIRRTILSPFRLATALTRLYSFPGFVTGLLRNIYLTLLVPNLALIAGALSVGIGVINDFNYALVEALKQANIEIPYPQTDLHLKSHSDSSLNPVR
ncbi:MAG: hypothetical protein GY820_14945 [Gammaproteobacteria bacterium]|nr:hypothetical protein [Gammaproteobacteria bacterium]